MNGYIGTLLGGSLPGAMLWWPICFLAVRGTFKLRYTWHLFLLGFALTWVLTTAATYLAQFVVPEDYQSLVLQFAIPIAVSLAILLSFVLIAKASWTSKSRPMISRGWFRVGVIAAVLWITASSFVYEQIMSGYHARPEAAMQLRYLFVWEAGEEHTGAMEGGGTFTPALPRSSALGRLMFAAVPAVALLALFVAIPASIGWVASGFRSDREKP